ncbi:hypothetical protein JN06_01389 [Bacteroides zoogleoformans]|uniref:XRE family transcriptional regulator n=1 Tax=Bacteroides zoogleoformans TaxID=28119 RepID=A0ABM6T9C6_9BACE|nr:hypothetical protein C4H11_10775 [Bacteroides zoogleoformans]TWJ14456.1 hypothetical protein JN06_01389 [Bacteroides zoogleoformans]
MTKKTDSSKGILQNSENLPFTEYCATLISCRGHANQRSILFKEVAAITGKSLSSVRRWALGITNPSPMEKEAVAKLLKSDVSVLFPKM